MNLTLEKGERVTTGSKDRVRLEVKQGWLQMHLLPQMAAEKGMERLVEAAGKVEVLLVVGGFDVDGGAEARLVKQRCQHVEIKSDGNKVAFNQHGNFFQH